MAKMKHLFWVLCVAGMLSTMSGCYDLPLLPVMSHLMTGDLPIVAVPPWVPERMEEKFTQRFRERTPIMPPILPGQPAPTCDDPPSDEEVIRALPKVARGMPFIYEEFRDDFVVVVEKL